MNVYWNKNTKGLNIVDYTRINQVILDTDWDTTDSVEVNGYLLERVEERKIGGHTHSDYKIEQLKKPKLSKPKQKVIRKRKNEKKGKNKDSFLTKLRKHFNQPEKKYVVRVVNGELDTERTKVSDLNVDYEAIKSNVQEVPEEEKNQTYTV